MASNLEVRLGGEIGGTPVTTRSLDFSEIRPLFDCLENAVIIEAEIVVTTRDERRSRGPLKPLTPVRLALARAGPPASGSEVLGAVYEFAVGAEAADAVARITAGLAGQDGIHLDPNAAEAVRRGLMRTIYRGLSVQLVNGVETPVFTVLNPPPDLPVHPTRKFETEIAAHILRVGGKGKLARVRLLGSGQEATVNLLGEGMARELGNHLYRDAILKGKGEWTVDPKRFFIPTRLLQFNVTGHRLLKPASMRTVIDEMTRATGGVWDDVDPTNPDQVQDAPGGTNDLP
jgi:hypothetical protein